MSDRQPDIEETAAAASSPRKKLDGKALLVLLSVLAGLAVLVAANMR